MGAKNVCLELEELKGLKHFTRNDYQKFSGKAHNPPPPKKKQKTACVCRACKRPVDSETSLKQRTFRQH